MPFFCSSRACQTLALALAYLAAASIGIGLTREAGNIAALWPANAILLTVLLRTPATAWPLFLIAAGLANLAANMSFGDGLMVSLGLVGANLLEALTGAVLMRRAMGGLFRLNGLKSFFVLVVLGAGLASAVGASVGAAVVHFAYDVPYLAVWPVWLVADAVGILLGLPLLLACSAKEVKRLARFRQGSEAALTTALLAATSAFLFTQDNATAVFFITPLLLWATLRLNILGAAGGAAVVAAIGVWMTISGMGPFATGATMAENIFELQVFLTVEVVPFLLLAAVLVEQGEKQRTFVERQSLLSHGAALAKFGYWSWDVETDRYTIVSTEVSKFYGLNPDDLIATLKSVERYSQFIHPEDRARYKAIIRETSRNGEPYEIEYRLRNKNGMERSYREVGGYLRDPSGKIVTGIGTTQDITEQKRQEELLRAAKAKAEAGDRVKSEFLATMSHEIRTPLNCVLGMIGLLEKTKLDDIQRSYTDIAREAADILIAIINDVLDYSKMEAGQIMLESIPHRLIETVESVISLLYSQAEAKGLALELSAKIDPSLVVTGDPNRLRQVLLNLVGNALKFTDRGWVRVLVEQQVVDQGRIELRFKVEDSGPGIPLAARAALFERFNQADSSTTRRFGGSGLGLAICKQLVELMGGTIGVESEPGQGSTFWFTLAATTVALPVPTALPPSLPEDQPFVENANPLRILVAEDDSINQLVIRLVLERAGHSIDLVGDGDAAVAAVQAKTYDLVLMDGHMPGTNGLRAAQIIRALPGPVATIPMIALTADAMAGERERYLAAGMNAFVTKPIDETQLFETMHQVTASGGEKLRAVG